MFSSRTLVVGAIKIFDGFVDYSRKAFDKLKIPQDQQPSDETLNIYHEQYLPRLVELQRLVQAWQGCYMLLLLCNASVAASHSSSCR